ncbi:peptidase [Edwardsiella hoshinae]|uniref:Peptidase n=1 Tax=Edwardsiella hoshinae TaxID=93378 RepID=A0A376DJQ0_9GAMM|nr:prepilin-type N-terminal cleavage/methylation domain-containing protein [Edwardsiella hoshinae]AOV97774.1 peptidase [Edwardsiella hoshinae]QPR29341.1 prepilin-type N-terminal cleavage/methylation domain-containing protein [Edwardsiella hoshinae]STC90725.1 Tfp pilus assembly protein FimT [Edwardsiella hoshinae]
MQGGQRGYTLLETLLVCALLALLAGGVTPLWMERRTAERLWSETLRLQRYLLALRDQAFHGNAARPLWLRRTQGVDCLVVRAGDDCRAAAAFVPAPPLRLTAQLSPLAGFYGLRNTAQPGHVRLSDARQATRVIWSAQGRVRVCAEQGLPALATCNASAE